MRWRGGRESDNVEDRRGMRAGGPVMVGGGLGMLALILIALFLGIDPRPLLDPQGMQPGGPAAGPDGGPAGGPAGGPVEKANDEMSKFVRVVLASTEDVWREQFRRQLDREYQDPKLVLFTDQVNAQGCGFASAAVGPFYCPADEKVYLDLSFFRALQNRFRAPGEFARAYVIAHEIGHHVQNQLGVSDRVNRMRGRVSEAEYNQLSVRLELQADFLAGVWAHHAEQRYRILEPGDIEAALTAAQAIGDDKLQKESQGYVVPDAFTHGTSAQRVRWFTSGLKSGRISDGDTFATDDL
jgi:predicted metalloprotease